MIDSGGNLIEGSTKKDLVLAVEFNLGNSLQIRSAVNAICRVDDQRERCHLPCTSERRCGG
jgi:hypothetical protein